MSISAALVSLAVVLGAPETDHPVFKIGGLLQPEVSVSPGDSDKAFTDGFQFRRLRPMLQATWGRFSFKLVTEFAGSRVRGQDVMLDVTLAKSECGSLVLRVGKDKPPISSDLLVSSTTMSFPERGPTAQLTADRDIGVSLLGRYGVVEGQVAVMNGTADVSNVDQNPDEFFEVFGRVGVTAGPLFVAASGSVGEADEGKTLPSYRSGGRRALFASGEVMSPRPERRWRLMGHTHLELGPVMAWFEMGQSHHRVTVGAWQAGVSVIVNGDGTNPWNRLDNPGDIELAARVGSLRTDMFGSREDDEQLGYLSGAFAATWHIDKVMKLMAGYELTNWDGAISSRPDEHVVTLRLQALLSATP